jgi:hypothetical protein
MTCSLAAFRFSARVSRGCLGHFTRTSFSSACAGLCAADEGCYRGGAFLFACSVPESYPHDPPKLNCLTKVGGRGWGCGQSPWAGQTALAGAASAHMV